MNCLIARSRYSAKFSMSIVFCLVWLLTCIGSPLCAQAASLKSLALEAHSKGQTEVKIPLFTDMLGANEDFHSIGESFSIFEGTPKKTYTEVGASFIRTWYAITPSNILKIATSCPFCDGGTSIPEVIKTGNTANTIYVAVIGGTALVDGVTIHQVSAAYANLEVGRQYLIIAAGKLRNNSPVFLSAGPNGVAKILPDGELQTISTKPTRLANSITSARTLHSVRSQFKPVQP